MKARFLRLVCLCICVAGFDAMVQAQNPGGPPHGGPPPGVPGPGNPGGSPPGGPGGGASPSASSAKGTTGGAARSGAQFGPVGRWWDDKSVIKTIGLSKDQQKKMDVIFDANKPAILQSYKTLLSEQSKYDKISKDPKVDQATLFAAIDSVSKARASLQKATAQMLLQIRQQMAPDQIAKLEKLQ